MKRYLLLIMLFVPLAAMAQTEDDIKQLIAHYSTKSNCTTVELSKDMLRSMGTGEGVDKLSIVSIEDTQLIPEFEKRVTSITQTLNTIMSVSHGGQQVRIYGYSPEGETKITEMIILTIAPDNAVVVWITGSNVQLSNMADIIDL